MSVKTRTTAQVAELTSMIEDAIKAADWEPGDAQRSLRKLRDEYDKASRRWRTGG